MICETGSLRRSVPCLLRAPWYVLRVDKKKMKSSLDYLKLAQEQTTVGDVVVHLVTNFTDALLQRLLTGVAAAAGIDVSVRATPYKQFDFVAKDQTSFLYTEDAALTCLFFDYNVYIESPFFVGGVSYREQLLADISHMVSQLAHPVVLTTAPLPTKNTMGNLYEHHAAYEAVVAYNDGLRAIAAASAHVHLVDIHPIITEIGNRHARDLRGLYAFDIPFTADLFVHLAQVWVGYLKSTRGMVRKCLVLDLDNTLWGGVVGELGPTGIVLGAEYPGSCFRAFQQTILSLYEQGVILAINSKNNPGDVDEVFEQNDQMILKKDHFSAIRINWDHKIDNMQSIAAELNIGTDSMVFLDDDPVNRDMVRQFLPEVAVPEFSLEPEHYVETLLSHNFFHRLSMTAEDRSRGRMYADERHRREQQETATNIDDYIASLQLRIALTCNDTASCTRIAQLTQKTNQCNLTTKRYTEADIQHLMESGRVYAATIEDQFGSYGLTCVAIVLPAEGGAWELDTFAMSCRTMGRRVEYTILDAILRDPALSVGTIGGRFIPTKKSMPAASFLADMSFETTEETVDGVRYALSLQEYRDATNPMVHPAIEITCEY